MLPRPLCLPQFTVLGHTHLCDLCSDSLLPGEHVPSRSHRPSHHTASYRGGPTSSGPGSVQGHVAGVRHSGPTPRLLAPSHTQTLSTWKWWVGGGWMSGLLFSAFGALGVPQLLNADTAPPEGWKSGRPWEYRDSFPGWAAPGRGPQGCPHGGIPRAQTGPGEAATVARVTPVWAATVGVWPQPPGPLEPAGGVKGSRPQSLGVQPAKPRGFQRPLVWLPVQLGSPAHSVPSQHDLPQPVHLPRPGTRCRSELLWGVARGQEQPRGGGVGATLPETEKSSVRPSPPCTGCLL